MPRFFFDIFDGEHDIRDEIGTEFPNLEAAKDEAVSVLPDIAREVLPDGNFRVLTSSVRSEDGQVLCRAMLSLAVVYLGEPKPRDLKWTVTRIRP